MVHVLSVNAIVNSFPSLTLHIYPGKPDYASIQYMHWILTTTMELIKINRGGGQNGHLGLILMATQYALVSQVPFVCPTDPI